MNGNARKASPQKVDVVGLCLVVVLLACGCGPSLEQHSQACQASNDARSLECANYWGKARQNQAATLSAKDLQAPASAQGYAPGYVPTDPVQGYPSPDVQRRRGNR